MFFLLASIASIKHMFILLCQKIVWLISIITYVQVQESRALRSLGFFDKIFFEVLSTNHCLYYHKLHII